MSHKHVFVDWSEVTSGYGLMAPGFWPKDASPYGIEIIPHRPEIDWTPVLQADRPWEKRFVNDYSTVLKTGGGYRLYYECFDTEEVDGTVYRVCLAVSEDGKHWTKPDLGLIDYKGSKQNNIVFNCKAIETEGYTFLYDTKAAADERYKVIYTTLVPKGDYKWLVRTAGAVSSDGLHFKEKGIFFEGGDTQGSFFYDEDTGKYVIYTKHPGEYMRRTIIRSESDTFGNFSKPEIVLYNNPCDPPDLDYYTSSCMKWPGASDAYVMFPAFYYHTPDTVNIHFACSRDGKTWYRPFGSEAMIDSSKSRQSNYAGVGILDNGDGTWSQFFSTSNRGHNTSKPETHYTYRMSFREDGYMSLRARSYGAFSTIPYTIDSDSLIINADIEDGGYLKVAVVDMKSSQPVNGYSFDECELKVVDAVHYAVVWKKPLEKLKGKTYRIAFNMFKADLYSYTM